jgi:type II secretory pathway pseudopilin PulG
METLVALVIVGIIAATFLSGLSTTAKASLVTDKQNTAESLARSQMEYAKGLTYAYEASEYTPASIPSAEDYDDFSASIAAVPLRSPDDGIQKITVTVRHNNQEVITLESYKVD